MRHTMRSSETTRSGRYPVLVKRSWLNRITSSEQDLQRQVSLVKSQLRDLRMSNDSNEAKLLNHSQRQGIYPLFTF